MDLVVASAELADGNVLSFKAFPTYPYSLRFSIAFHVLGEVTGEIAYRVRKWEEVIYQSEPTPLHIPQVEGQKMFTHVDSIELVFPSQGSYLLDIIVDGAVLHSLAFSVFDSSNRTDLEREIIYYLKSKRGPRSVKEITRGVYNPKLLNKANVAEVTAKVYFALLRMSEVINMSPTQQGSLAERMDRSRWQLKQ